jgi:penicillin-binding protein 1A
MDNMMQDVTRYGTAARVARLGRTDLAGKTGTTNEFVDAWFAGYQPALVGISWVGFDQPKTLGKNQTGSVVALPIWLSYMEKILKDMPEIGRAVPPGVVTVPIVTLPPAGIATTMPVEAKTVPEYFYSESVPPPEVLRPPIPVAPPPPPPPVFDGVTPPPGVAPSPGVVTPAPGVVTPPPAVTPPPISPTPVFSTPPPA